MELVIAFVTLVLFLWWLVNPSLELWRKAKPIPGKPTWPIVGNAFQYHLVGTRSQKEIMQSKEDFGNVFRIWLGPQLHIFIFHPDDIQMLLTSQNLITKSNLYKVLDKWLGTGLLVSTGDLWQKRRKAITPTFHFKVLDDFVPIFDKCANTLVNLLRQKVDDAPFVITPYVSNCALDAVAESAMGITVEAQTKPKSEYVSTIHKMTHSLGIKANFPWLGIEPLYTLTGRKKDEEENLKILHSLPRHVLEQKKSITSVSHGEEQTDEFGIKTRKAFLELLLCKKNLSSPAFATDQDILDEVTTFMFEGHDTTTSCLSFTLWLLGKHLDVQEKVYQEISPILEGEKELNIEDLQNMKYLERVIKESLRLFPPVPNIGRTVQKDIVLPKSGLLIPAPSEVYVPIFALHRDPQYFKDPEVFNPDRFLEEFKHPFCYIPFSAGPRNCIGQKFAMYDVKAIIAKVIFNYKIKAEEDVVVDSELVLRAKNGPKISLTLRQK